MWRRNFLVWVCAALAGASVAQAGLMNREAVVIGGQLYYAQNANRDWSLDLTGTPACLYRFEVRTDDRWVNEVPSSTAERTELQGPADSANPAAFRTPVWTAYQFKVEPGPASAARWVVLGDWHVRPDPGDTASMSSPWQLELLPGDFLVFDTQTSGEKPVVDAAPAHFLWRTAAPIVRGVWHSIVSRANFDWRPKGEGSVALWFDGAKVVDYNGPIGYNNTKPPYFKFGIYRAPTPERLVVDYADVVTSRASLQSRIRAPSPTCANR